MRILVAADVPKDPNSGASGDVYWANQALRELGHEVDEIYSNDLGRRIAHGNLHYLLELPFRFRKLVAERCAIRDYDVIQISQPHAYLAAKDHQRFGRPGIFVNRSHGVEPMVNETVDSWRKKLNVRHKQSITRKLPSQVLQRLLDRRFIYAGRYCDGFIVSAGDNADYLVEHLKIPADRIAVVPGGLTPPFLERTPLALKPERLRKILCVSQYSFFKGTQILTEIVSRVLVANPELSFTWVTSEDSMQLALEGFDQPLRPRIRVISGFTQDELVDIYDQHGIFVFTSFFEGFGKTPLEAMSRGLCVVSSSVGGMRDYIVDGVNGFLHSPGDIEGMTSRILTLTKDPGQATSIGARARDHACTYSWRRSAEGFVNFYHLLLKMKKA